MGDCFLVRRGGGINTSDATITPSKVLLDEVGYGPDGKVIGSIPLKAAQIYTPGTANIIIPAGQYLSEDQTILGESTLLPGNIPSDMNFFGVQGVRALGINGAAGVTTSESTTTAFKYLNNTTYNAYKLTVTGLNFLPKFISMVAPNSSGYSYVVTYWSGNGVNMLLVSGWNSDTGANTNVIKVRIESPVSVTSTGFVLPAPWYANWTWVARP